MPGHRIFIILENPKERMEYVRFFEDLGFLVDATPDGSNAPLISYREKTGCGHCRYWNALFLCQ